MLTLALVGFVGGLVTGISPCILPVLPVIFFAGAQHGGPELAARNESGGDVAVATKPRRGLSETLRPYRVIGGLVFSFSVVTLTGSALLSLLHLPQDAIRWVALVALVAIGLGLMFPTVEQLLERPFSRIPQRQADNRRSGFGLGLALGVLYVPARDPCWPRSWWPGLRRKSVSAQSFSHWRSRPARRCRCCSSRWPASGWPSG